MVKSVKNYTVYLLRLGTNKHYYIGATKNIEERLQVHAETPILEGGSSFPTKTYGFSGLKKDILALYSCQTWPEALALERSLVRKYIVLCPDTAIFGGGVHFNLIKPLHPEEGRSFLTQYASF